MKQLLKLSFVLLLIRGGSDAFAKPKAPAGTDSLVTVSTAVQGFNALQIAGPFDVHLQQGNTESISYQAPREVLSRIITEVSGNTLRISNKHDNWGWGGKSWWSDKSWWHHHGKIIVHVTVKDLNSIKVSGSGDAFFDQLISVSSLKLTVRGSGQVHGKLSVQELVSDISGSGDINLTGTAGSSRVRISGSGHFVGSDLVTSSSAVRVSGSGNAKINARDKVVAAVSGSGDVRYTGDAKSVQSSTTGSGNVSRF